MPPSGPDPRIFVSTGRDLITVPVMSIPAVSKGSAILYVKGFNDDGTKWPSPVNFVRSPM